MSTLPEILLVSEEVCIVAGLLCGLCKLRSFNTAFRLIWLQVLLELVAEITGTLLARKGSNVWFYNIYPIVDFWVLMLAAKMLLDKKVFKYITYLSITGLTALWIATLAKNDTANFFSSWVFIPAWVIVDILYVAILIRSFSSGRYGEMRRSVILLCAGILLYYAGNIPFFGLFNYLAAHHYKAGLNLWAINDVLSIGKCLCVLAAFVFYKKIQTTSNLPHDR